MSRCESDLGNIHQQLQTLDHSTANIDEQGYCILDRTLPPTECERWSSYVYEGLSRAEIGPLRTGREQTTQTYGSRNVLSLLPRIVELANIPVVFELCQAVLGEKLGVVRAARCELGFTVAPRSNDSDQTASGRKCSCELRVAGMVFQNDD
jgi:hypothetical protein